MHPKTDGILESSLYVSDLPRSARFYQETFGFPVISEFGGRGCAMHAALYRSAIDGDRISAASGLEN